MTNKDKIIEEEIEKIKRGYIIAEEKRRSCELRRFPKTRFEDINRYKEHLDKSIIPIMVLQAELKGRQEALKEKGLIKIEKVNNLKKRLKDSDVLGGGKEFIILKINDIDKIFSEEIGLGLLEGENDMY